MLRWRLLLGTILIAAVVALVWLDSRAATPGVWLFPLALALSLLAGGEVLRLTRHAGLRVVGWVVHLGNLAIVAASWLPLAFCADASGRAAAGWPLAALGVAVAGLFLCEMRRYQRPGGITANLAAGTLALAYCGGLIAVLVQLRMFGGVEALAVLVIVVKMGDTGAYTVGRLIGRHKMAPVLSPGKTVEGGVGHLAFACLGAYAVQAWLYHGAWAWWQWLAVGLILGASGMIGDLAESLLKRDVGCKDSSDWLPGFGGVLDILDSILLAAPAAWLCWAIGLFGNR